MSDLKKEQSWLITISLVILAVVAIGAILVFARAVLVPFVLSIFIAQILSPILDYQVIKLKLPRYIAIVITLLIVIIILGVLCIMIGQASYTVASKIGNYSDTFINFLNEGVLKIEQRLEIQIDQEQIITDLKDSVPGYLTSTLGNIVGFLSSFVLVSIFVIFLMIGRSPRAAQKGIYAEIDQKVKKYLYIKTVISIVTGVLVWAILASFGLELASVFGILAFLLNFIPSIGSIIASLLPIPIAVTQFSNPWYIALVILCPCLVQMVMGNAIEPKLMGKGLNLHPVTVLLSLALWGLLWGIPGMFLAAPMTAIIRIILMQFDTLRPMGMLLAGQLPKQKNSDFKK